MRTISATVKGNWMLLSCGTNAMRRAAVRDENSVEKAEEGGLA
jgi:hypothetical protein